LRGNNLIVIVVNGRHALAQAVDGRHYASSRVIDLADTLPERVDRGDRPIQLVEHRRDEVSEGVLDLDQV